MTKLTLQRGLAVAVTFALLLLVFELVRRKRLSERYAILWLLAAITLFVLAAWKGLLTSLSNDVGISYPPSALFAVAIGLIAMILLHFSLAVSRLTDQNKILAQRLALLQQRVEEPESQTREATTSADEDPPPTGVAAHGPPSGVAAEELSSSR
ncbi:MAG TPA: DUF2304 domain-containing protein [Solirubrobacteraceae bacterium]|jgi:hypothetical protein|nr:DUF2304 domain-containing protein [Solirubrobacteraceae bacterium]